MFMRSGFPTSLSYVTFYILIGTNKERDLYCEIMILFIKMGHLAENNNDI
jgi:hypothetical protein